MFYLRQIDRENDRVSNSGLGNSYVTEHRDLVDANTTSIPSTFTRRCKEVLKWMDDDNFEKVYAIVYDKHGQAIPLFKDSQNYIMTEKGSTYEKL